jgi:glycosyltransferase involved in cell wall biosynthesis
MIDIFIGSYLRQEYTRQTIKYLKERTKYPYRLFLLDNGGNKELKNEVDIYIGNSENLGIHALWNMALSLAESDYFITSDNDIFVPDLEPDWLTQMVQFMDERPDYGAISLCPHVFIGAAGIDPNEKEDVLERNMCGAVMRIMRTDAVRKAGGWLHVIRTGRNHEESTICSQLQTAGYKVGIATRVRAYHPFGKGIEDNGGGWGYPASFTPEMQKHRPELKDYVISFDQPDAYDEKTFLPK